MLDPVHGIRSGRREWSTCDSTSPSPWGRGGAQGAWWHEAPFVVAEHVEGRLYADTTILDDAELTVHHSAVPAGSGSALVLRAWLTGARAAEYAERMRDDVQRSLDTDLAALARMLESEHDSADRRLT